MFPLTSPLSLFTVGSVWHPLFATVILYVAFKLVYWRTL